MTQPSTGIIVGGCRLDREIGRGGASTVYSAEQLGVNRRVAVKLIAATGDGLTSSARFQREAAAAGSLDHPHCLPVYAAGEQDGLFYLVMRLVNGPDLADLVRREGPLDPARVVALIHQVASAVDHAHHAGLVHRDLKPANILIEDDGGVGHAFVSDFGLMRAVSESEAITLAGQWVGTPQFAAPEQQRGEPVGPAADIYALGAVLASALGPAPPRVLLPVIARAMHPDPAERFVSAGALAAAARAAITPPRGRGGARALSAGGGLVAIAAVVVIVLALTGHHGGASPSSATGAQITGTGPISGTATSTTPVAGRLIASTFSARLPAGWVTTADDVAMVSYHRSVVQNPAGSTVVDIDRTPAPDQSLAAHAQGVETATAQNPDYHLISLTAPTVTGGTEIVWSFALSGQAAGQRVDVFRMVGGKLFAVLGMSDSLSASRGAATFVADSLTAR